MRIELSIVFYHKWLEGMRLTEIMEILSGRDQSPQMFLIQFALPTPFTNIG